MSDKKPLNSVTNTPGFKSLAQTMAGRKERMEKQKKANAKSDNKPAIKNTVARKMHPKVIERIAEKRAQKADKYYQMSDNPMKSRGYKVKNETEMKLRSIYK